MSDQGKVTTEQHEFKAEMKQLLHLIVHSLYTNKEIFIRELVSNSSDALNKIRFNRLTDSDINDPEAELRIDITVDKEKELFSIEDTGIGMTKDELIGQLGTIASSGTLEFLKNISEEKKSFDANMIGQFGVGFYSVFMVTDSISVETQSAKKDSQSYNWQSVGEDTFSLEEIDSRKRGTQISFKLQEDQKEFYDPETVKRILKKYSNFVEFPIYVNGEPVERVSALWHKKKDEIKDEELTDFYKFISNDFSEPLGHLHVSIEGVVNFKSLIFFPSTAPATMFQNVQEKTLSLYSNKIFITDEAKEILPDYLNFVKGVVDTEDLPLNVSREVTQSSPVMTKIRNILTGKILSLFEDWAENDKDKYIDFYKKFSSLFKTGINSDYTNKSRLIDLLRIETSKNKKGELISLKDYVSNMKDDQKEIFFISGDHREAIEKNPNLEYFRKNDIEVILLTDPVDIFTFPYIMDYDGKAIKSIDKVDLDIKKDETTGDESLSEKDSQKLIVIFKEVLKDKVEDVVESKRLVESAATLVVGTQGMDPQMEKMMQIMDKGFSGSKRILEINPSHDLIKNLYAINMEDVSHPLLEKCINHIYESALLIEGHLKSSTDYVARMTDLMVEATRQEK